MNAAQVMNLAQLLRQTARQFPDLPGLIHGDTHLTWRQLDERVDALVAALRQKGLQQGDRILVQSRNNLALFESCWVAFRMGCVWVPTNFRLTPPEVAYLGKSSGAVAMLAEPDFAEHVQAVSAASDSLTHVVWIGESAADGMTGDVYEDLVSRHLGQQADESVVGADDPLWFFYTSGTTGAPKAGILTHGQMAFVVTNHLADLIPGTTEKDCSIAVAPLSHGAGIHMLLNVARGAATVLPESDRLVPEEVWRLVEKHKVSNLFTVPTIVKRLVEDSSVDQFDHSSLRYLIYAGAPMYRSDQKFALEKLGKVLVQYFGLGEVTGCITVLNRESHSADDDDPDANVGSCGRPRTGMEVGILDEQLQRLPVGEVGEICCRGPAVFAGYHANDEATAKALRGGWFHTGDLGRIDERGFLTITGRESDMYISGGSNVYPREVEEVLLSHSEVAEVAVLGVPDQKWGEVGLAVVVPRNPAEPPAAHQLLAHLEGRCARYRWPASFVIWPALPKSGYGKVTKKIIREQLIERGELSV
ncbi:MAG: acyl-CoA synthetase [Burkholderiaceae bacterium]